MTSSLFTLESNKFSTENIQATLICSKCREVFAKEFPLDLEGQTIEFKCPVCSSPGQADLPYKSSEERENLDLDLDQVENEQENSEEFESY
jgi:Zn finger protein HypA/HybF involved in hydrogenase expression